MIKKLIVGLLCKNTIIRQNEKKIIILRDTVSFLQLTVLLFHR